MSLESIFDDAHRRVCIARQRGEFDRARIWTGLGFPSEMKPAVARGMMVPLHGRETPRVLNWYLFTAAGWAEYDRRFAGAPDYFETEGKAA